MKRGRNETNRTDERLKKISDVLSKRTTDLTVVLENINDPHNLSAVVRSCDAVGVLNIHLIYYGGQPIPQLSPISSASAVKWMNFIKHDSVRNCFDMLHSEGKKIFTTHLCKESVSVYDLDLVQPVALVFGNEHSGVSEEAYNISDGNFLIPQVGMIQSLNISVAASVSLFEAYRQRMTSGKYNEPQLDTEKIESLFKEWSKK